MSLGDLIYGSEAAKLGFRWQWVTQNSFLSCYSLTFTVVCSRRHLRAKTSALAHNSVHLLTNAVLNASQKPHKSLPCALVAQLSPSQWGSTKITAAQKRVVPSSHTNRLMCTHDKGADSISGAPQRRLNCKWAWPKFPLSVKASWPASVVKYMLAFPASWNISYFLLWCNGLI